MKIFKYFFQFILVILSFILFKILGPNLSSRISGNIFEIIGPFFRSKTIIQSNIKKALPEISSIEIEKITRLMWNNYGRVFSEYMFLKDFRSGKLTKEIQIEGQDIIDKIKKSNRQVVFVSGHLSNFELMALYLEKNNIPLAAIYRPLNNIFLNKIIERIRENFICKKQIKKGIGGMKKLIALKKKNFSTALMIDQRVSEGILSKFFNEKALTTTIPAKLAKRFNISIVPIYIERINGITHKITIYNPLNFKENDTVQDITDNLNKILEKMIIKKPQNWIWSHNRWK